MIRIADVFPGPDAVSALSRTLGWSHYVEIIHLQDEPKCDF